jgi:hypothetical protein
MDSRTFKAFFSYSHLDARTDPGLVEALTRTLEDRVAVKLVNDNFEVWRDTEGLRTGDRWDARIEEALRISDVLIVLLTPRWIGSDYCRREYRIFEEVERERGGDEYVAPILARPLERQQSLFNEDQKSMWSRLNTRQHQPVMTIEFLKLDDDDRVVLVDKIADHIEEMLGRRRAQLAAAAIKLVSSPAELERLQRELSRTNEAAERRHQEMLALIGKEKEVPREQLEPILAGLGYENVPVDQIADRLRDAVDSLRAKAAEPVRPSNEGTEIDQVIRQARAKLLGTLNTEAAMPTQSRSFDHLDAIASLDEAVRLDSDRLEAWIALGKAHRIIGSLACARRLRWRPCGCQTSGQRVR